MYLKPNFKALLDIQCLTSAYHFLYAVDECPSIAASETLPKGEGPENTIGGVNRQW